MNGDLHDATRADLYEYVVDFLTSSSDQALVWKYADWALQRSEEVCALSLHLGVALKQTEPWL